MSPDFGSITLVRRFTVQYYPAWTPFSSKITIVLFEPDIGEPRRPRKNYELC